MTSASETGIASSLAFTLGVIAPLMLSLFTVSSCADGGGADPVSAEHERAFYRSYVRDSAAYAHVTRGTILDETPCPITTPPPEGREWRSTYLVEQTVHESWHALPEGREPSRFIERRSTTEVPSFDEIAGDEVMLRLGTLDVDLAFACDVEASAMMVNATGLTGPSGHHVLWPWSNGGYDATSGDALNALNDADATQAPVESITSLESFLRRPPAEECTEPDECDVDPL